MGDPRVLLGFGEVDLDLDQEAEDDAATLAIEPVPPSTSRVFKNAGNEERTRVVTSEGLIAITRPPPAPSEAPDQSVEARSERVAAMRELYASGDAEGALAMAATLEVTLPPPGMSGDSPEASIIVEFDEQSIAIDDPFGGLIPMDDDAVLPEPSAAAHLSLTERQSIPRLIKSMGEISKLKIDHRAGFLLAHVDGMQTLEEILDICAMPSFEALELITQLREMGVIEFE